MFSIRKSDFIFFLTSSLILTIILFRLDVKWDLVGGSFYLNLITMLLLLSLSFKKQVTSSLFVYMFFLMFFIVIPWVQYSNEVVLWSNTFFSNSDYLDINLILFFILICFYSSYRFGNFSNFNFFNDLSKESKKFSFKLAFLMCIICFIIVLYSKGFSLNNLFFRGLINRDHDIEEVSNPFLNVVVYFSRFFPVFLFLKYLTSTQKKSFSKQFILFLFVLLCASPLGIPRFMVAYVYFPIVFYYVRFLRNSYFTFIFLTFSLLLFFPFLEQFRSFDPSNSLRFLPKSEFFMQAHFDAYQNFMEVLRVHFITYGWQLLGVILFFIPRFIWPDKPVGSGYQMANNLDYFFNNISMPFFAEGFVNFGFIGITIFTVFLGFWCKTVDTKLLTSANSSKNSYGFFIGVFYCAAIFFMMRGDLMSSFSYMLAGIIAYKIANKF